MRKKYLTIIVPVVVLAALLFSRIAYISRSSSAADISAALTLPPTSAISAGAPPAPASTSTPSPAALSPNPLVFQKTGDAPAPHLPDEASLVADLAGDPAFESVDADTRWPTASLTKLMTATLVFDHFNLTQKITITPDMFSADPMEQTLAVGGTYSVNDLLHLMLMPSSNVAAQAFADQYGLAPFMDLMNERAKAWGMTDTFFDDPSGISAANQSTPDDLLTLARKVYAKYPQILAITDTPQTFITDLNSGSRSPVASINEFAGAADFIGGKTGHTPEADGNLLSIFNYDGKPFIVIVLGSNNRFGDTRALYTWFKTNYK